MSLKYILGNLNRTVEIIRREGIDHLGRQANAEQQVKKRSTKERNNSVDLRKTHQQERELAIETAIPQYLYSE